MCERPIGHYVTCDEAECAACFQRAGGQARWLADGGFEDWAEALAIFRDSESDSPTHCHDCGRLIEHGLTDTGLRYVAESGPTRFLRGQAEPRDGPVGQGVWRPPPGRTGRRRGIDRVRVRALYVVADRLRLVCARRSAEARDARGMDGRTHCLWLDQEVVADQQSRNLADGASGIHRRTWLRRGTGGVTEELGLGALV